MRYVKLLLVVVLLTSCGGVGGWFGKPVGVGFGAGGLSFDASEGGADPAAQTVTIDVTPDGLDWTASTTETWLSVSPTSGNGNATLTVSISVAGLTEGVHTAQLVIDCPATGLGPFSLTVTIVVSPAGGTYAISGTISGDVQAGVTVALSGDATDSTVSAAGGTYSFSGLANGSYTVTPDLAGYSFTPSSRTVTVSGALETGVDFVATATPPPGPGWTHVYYDMAGTSYNPCPTDSLRQGGLLELWSDPAVSQNVVVFSGDVDGDGEKEVVLCQTRTVRIYSGGGTLEKSFDLPGAVSHHVRLLADAESDGDLDIFLESEDEGGTLTAYAYDALGNQIQTYVRGSAGSDSYIFPVTVLPDGKLLVQYFAGFSTQPRGWGCYDSASGSNIWHYELGETRGASVVNVPSVGWRLVEGWGTIHNGHSANGTTDGDLYTVVLDQNGSAVFTQNYSSNGPTDGVVYCRILDLDGDGTYHVLAIETHSPSSYPGMSQAHLLNIDTGAFERTVDIVNNTGMSVTEAIADFDGDGKDEVVFGAGGGGASYVTRMLDDNIDLLLPVQYANPNHSQNRPRGVCPSVHLTLASRSPSLT